MNILITGVAGFIGFNAAKDLIIKKHRVLGLDNLDNYYSLKIKKTRLKNLKKYKNFFFYKIDLTNKKKLILFFKNKKIDLIIHLAAQAGVRYSFINPNKYVDNNFFGFLNLILCARENKVKKIIYASSSSVYGDCKKLPVNENANLDTKNIYAVTKKLNEDTAELYSKLSYIKFVGLRFFTIFGEWGRPDMLIFKIFKSYFSKKILHVNNYGNHYRDFTYIEDVIKILNKLITKKINKHEIFNVCSNNPINISDLIDNFSQKYQLKKKFIKLHKADVINTHGNNIKIKKFLKLKKFSNFYHSFYKTFKWYKENKIYKIL
jgi:UDP-glucuronate 4-epimerase